MRHLGPVALAALLLPVLSGAAPRTRSTDPASRLRPAGLQYLSPLPGSALHPAATSIAIRCGDVFVRSNALDMRRWTVAGATSGVHAGQLALSCDARTLTFQPGVPFAGGERVHVAIASGITTLEGRVLPSFDWWFDVRGGDDAALRALALRIVRDEEPETAGAGALPMGASGAATPAVTLGTPLPSSYSPVTVSMSNYPDTVGGIFLSPFTSILDSRGHLLVVDHRGEPLFFRSLPGLAFDFRRQPNGLLTYWTYPGVYFGMDSTYTIVNEFACGNNYSVDLHDMQLLPNGHALLMAYDPEPYPMDTVVAGGRADAIVTGLIVQEIDEGKNVVFQWRSWDHFRVTDLVECAAHLTDAVVDYVHGNSIEEDFDGNLLISSRHMDEITKIDRLTGDILWRLGPHAKNNQFTFFDDQTGFSHQHDVRRLPNGNLSVFDNGNCVSLQSRTVEYRVDETNLTAELVHEYSHLPAIDTPFMGNRQLRPDGSVTVGWGGATTNPRVTELHPDGSVALELGLGSGLSYRALRFPWETTALVAEEQLAFGGLGIGEQALLPLRLTNKVGTVLHVNQFVSTDSSFQVASPDSLVLFPGGSGTLLVRFSPLRAGNLGADLYVRAVNDTQIVARVVHLTGTGTILVGVGEGGAVTEFALRPPVPNPVNDEASIAFEIPRATGLSLEVFDVRGRRVADLVEGSQAPGRHLVHWSTAGDAAGVYFVRMRAAGRTFTRRAIVAH